MFQIFCLHFRGGGKRKPNALDQLESISGPLVPNVIIFIIYTLFSSGKKKNWISKPKHNWTIMSEVFGVWLCARVQQSVQSKDEMHLNVPDSLAVRAGVKHLTRSLLLASLVSVLRLSSWTSDKQPETTMSSAFCFVLSSVAVGICSVSLVSVLSWHGAAILPVP